MLVSDSVLRGPAASLRRSGRPELKGQVRHRHLLQPGGGGTSREKRRGEGLTERLLKYDVYRKMLADHFDEPEDTAMHKGRPVRAGGQAGGS